MVGSRGWFGLAGVALCAAAGVACREQPVAPSRDRIDFGRARARHAADAPLDILVVTLCSVRPDHVGAYGYAAAVTPTMDALAGSGTRFTHAWSNATFTLPAHAALLTGLLPSHAGVMESSDHLGTTMPTLPEVLGLYGYQTAAWAATSSASSFRPGEGLERGFASFADGATAKPQFIDALDTDKPYFALAHFKDAHPPYGGVDPAEDPRIQAWVRQLANPDAARLGSPALNLGPLIGTDANLRKQLYARYDHAVTRADASLGGLLSSLSERGLLQHAVIVVLGDHGESLGEGGVHGHQVATPKVAEIPMIIDLPDGADQAMTVDEDVSIVDLFPTIAALTGASAPATLDGRSLVGALHGEPLTPKAQVVQALARRDTPGGGPQRYTGVEVLAEWPYWLEHRPDTAWSKLYKHGEGWALVDDPTETAKLLADRAALGDAGTWPTEAKPVSAEVRDEIRKAGYW